MAVRIFVALFALGAASARAAADEFTDGDRRTAGEASALPSSLAETPAVEAQAEEDFFGTLDAGAHVGFLAFSSHFRANPAFCAGIEGRSGLPWFSHSVVGLEDRDAFGLFLDFSFSSIDRRIRSLDQRSGVLFFATLGVDYTAYKDDLFFVRPQMALQYGYFGGVTDLVNGAAFVLGAKGGLQFSQGFWATFNPQMALGHAGDLVFFFNFGVDYVF
jgi:hypothetical protein